MQQGFLFVVVFNTQKYSVSQVGFVLSSFNYCHIIYFILYYYLTV